MTDLYSTNQGTIEQVLDKMSQEARIRMFAQLTNEAPQNNAPQAPLLFMHGNNNPGANDALRAQILHWLQTSEATAPPPPAAAQPSPAAAQPSPAQAQRCTIL